MEDARVKAEAEASKIIAQAEQKGRQIIEEARKKLDLKLQLASLLQTLSPEQAR